MARYTGSSYKRARRVGISLLENGREFKRRSYGPGEHGPSKKGKTSDYGQQLKEKQKLRFMYGVNERQFRKTFGDALKMAGVNGDDFFKLLESRLDNLVYRIGFASTRRGARQLVNHGHVTVNGKKVDIPSYRCKPGDVISLKEKDKELKVVKEALEKVVSRVDFVTFDANKMEGVYVRMPERHELTADINDSQIVEYYNRLN